MLTHPTLDKLQALKFTGMAAALNDQLSMPDIDELPGTFKLRMPEEKEEEAKRRRKKKRDWQKDRRKDRRRKKGDF